jgi:hypothetical protein
MRNRSSGGVRRAGEHLNRLLAGPYRHVWLNQAGRLRQTEVNKLAVARVIAHHLWETGDRSEREHDLADQLRDRVGRALGGEVLTPPTLTWFIDAFHISGGHASRLWSLLYGDPDRDQEDDGWYVRSLRTVLALDGETPTATEYRTIVATRDDLREITTSVSVPRVRDDGSPDHRLLVEALSGGTIETQQHPHLSHFRQVFALPAPIDAGRTHEFVIRRTVPVGQPMAPHYVHVPSRRIDRFELRIRFGDRLAVPTVWRLDGVPTSVIYDAEPTADVLPGVDGEVHTEFRTLVRGFAYGLCWTDGVQPATATASPPGGNRRGRRGSNGARQYPLVDRGRVSGRLRSV